MKNKKDIENTLKEEVAVILNVEASKLNSEMPLADLGLDSLKFVELLVVIEKTFDINLMESGLSRDDFQSIASLAQRITEINEK